jgi:hypothetical protein
MRRDLLYCTQDAPYYLPVPSSLAVLGLLIYREISASLKQNRQQCVTYEPHILRFMPLSCTSFFVYLEGHF